MLFRQLLDETSRTFTYLVASRRGGEALLIDPVLGQVELYLRLVEAFDLRLVLAIDTHSHHDHDSALGVLFDETECVTAMGQQAARAASRGARAPFVARLLYDGEVLDLDGLQIEAMHTPGHTEDSYSLVMADRVFTGDTLLIRGTGRTDLGGDARVQYSSLFSKLLRLPGGTLVYPAHDYQGRYVSSIADERRLNPRLQALSMEEYVAVMEGLRPAHPLQSDVVPRPSLHPSAPLMRQLLALKSARFAGSPIGALPKVS